MKMSNRVKNIGVAVGFVVGVTWIGRFIAGDSEPTKETREFVFEAKVADRIEGVEMRVFVCAIDSGGKLAVILINDSEKRLSGGQCTLDAAKDEKIHSTNLASGAIRVPPMGFGGRMVITDSLPEVFAAIKERDRVLSRHRELTARFSGVDVNRRK